MTDMPTIGGNVIWHRNCVGQKRVARKLDRAIADIMWRHHFSEAYVDVFCRFHSDHNLILLRCGGLHEARGDRLLWFEAAWMTNPEY